MTTALRARSRRPSALQLVSICVFAAAAVACSATEELPRGSQPLRFETEHFRYHATEGTAVCYRTPELLELVYATLTEYLGVDPERSAKIDYYYDSANRDVTAQCGIGSGCAALDKVILSTQALSKHELVHIVATQGYGDVPAFFAEGLAHTLDCSTASDLSPMLDKERDVLSMMQASRIDGNYDQLDVRIIARSFVHYLIVRFGKDRFLEFYGLLDPEEGNLDKVRGKFRAAFGVQLEDVIETWKTEPENQDESCTYLLECQGESVSGSIDLDLPCGFTSLATQGHHYFPFEIGGSGRVRIELDGAAPAPGPSGFTEGGLAIRVASCASGDYGLSEQSPPMTQIITAPPGRYFVHLIAGEHTPGKLRVEPLGSARDLCDAEPIPLSAERLVVLSRRGVEAQCEGLPWCPGDFIALKGAQDGKLIPNAGRVLQEHGGFPQQMFLCDQCPVNSPEGCRSDPYVEAVAPGAQLNVLLAPIKAGQTFYAAMGFYADSEISYATYSIAPQD